MGMACRVNPSGVRGSLRNRLTLGSGRSVLSSEGKPLPIVGGFVLWAFAAFCYVAFAAPSSLRLIRFALRKAL